MARSLVLLKPDAVKRNLIGEIIKRFEDKGLKVIGMEMMTADKPILVKHYNLDNYDYVLTLGHVDPSGMSVQEKKDRYDKNLKILEAVQDYVASGPIVKMVLEGDDNAVALIREIVGKTDPSKADKGSIRGDLGEDSFEAADKESRSVYNLIHASGNDGEAKAEINLWFPGLA
jgi:nucleoside-diphosphate kinase